MRKIFIALAYILLVCSGCGHTAVSPGTSEPTDIATVTPEPMISAAVTPEFTVSATVTPEPTAIPIVENYILNGDSIILRSGLRISDLESYFDFTGSELIQKLGDKYEPVGAGVENTWDGYYYRNLGITLVFNDYDYDFDEAPLMWIDCDVDQLELNGLTEDMSFDQIQERIGEGEIKRDTVQDGLDEYGYYLTYKIGKIMLTFFSFSKDGSDGYSVTIDYNYDL